MKIYKKSDVNQIIDDFNNDKVIAFPTETVFGLAINSRNKVNYKKLVEVKNRDSSKPFTLMVSNIDDIKKYAYVDKNIEKILNKFMPGELTIILRKKENIPDYFDLNTGFIGFRIPNDNFLLSIFRKLKYPLFVPSANPKDMPPARNILEIKNYFEDKIDGVIEGEITNGTPSTVIKIIDDKILLLREGNIKLKEIEEIFYE